MTTPKPRWFHLTPDRLSLACWPSKGLLWLSERLRLARLAQRLRSPDYRGSVGIAFVLMLIWFALALVFR